MNLLPALVRSAPVDPDRATARRWAVEELTDQAYVQAQPGLLQRAIQWVFDRVGDLVERADGASTGTGLVVGLALVAAVVVGALLVAGPLRRRARTARQGGAVFGAVVRTAAEHRAASEDAARAGRWDAAVQERFRAVARSLEERVVLDARPGRPADEVAREGGAVLAGTAAPLAAAARAFDDVTYGDRPGTEAGYRACTAADDAVRAARPGVLPAAGATVGGPGGAADGAAGGGAGGGADGGAPVAAGSVPGGPAGATPAVRS
ncbi:DUF4129 domain-containing protein [Aquipuribacter hungaricus]|uniref:DUF4129 domain-containing protein n=1 Tax=Aquipuribacter hungaricus TaxID=545624 RepID=A0ABV7WE97_9MICO